MNKREKLAYLAGRLEERGTLKELSNGRFRVSLRTDGKLPKKLKRKFGGTCFEHGGSLWYRAQGENAIKLLEAVFPYLVRWKKKAQRLLALKTQGN